jgi:hypothetical protein
MPTFPACKKNYTTSVGFREVIRTGLPSRADTQVPSMDFNPLDLILHLDVYLDLLVNNYGPWIYAILFLVIFCETGLVVMPFLPGDSLLFIAGAVAAGGGMDPVLLGGC